MSVDVAHAVFDVEFFFCAAGKALQMWIGVRRIARVAQRIPALFAPVGVTVQNAKRLIEIAAAMEGVVLDIPLPAPAVRRIQHQQQLLFAPLQGAMGLLQGMGGAGAALHQLNAAAQQQRADAKAPGQQIEPVAGGCAPPQLQAGVQRQRQRQRQPDECQ